MSPLQVTINVDLIISPRDGDLLTKNGRSEVVERGPHIFQQWLAASK